MKICAVWSRSYGDVGVGRAKTVSAIRQVMAGQDVRHCVVKSRVELGAAARFGLLLSVAWEILRGGRRPVQALLYASGPEIRRVCDEIEAFAPDVVFIDTVRLLPFVIVIRARWPALRIVIDMDDLFSTRYAGFARDGVALNLGYLKDRVPRLAIRLLGAPWGAKAFYRREAAALVRAEEKGVALSDAVVLVSCLEADLLRARVKGALAARVHVNVPPPPVVVEALPAMAPPFHFVFIGADRLEQNAATISYLLDLWRRRAIAAPLVLHGRMTRPWQAPDNVRFAGFAPDLAAVYAPNAILLSPSFTKGGVKTKVIEAFGFGTPVVGTAITFNGIATGHSLCFDDLSAMEDFVAHVDDRATLVRQAQQQGHTFARANDQGAYSQRWMEVLAPGPAAAD